MFYLNLFFCKASKLTLFTIFWAKNSELGLGGHIPKENKNLLEYIVYVVTAKIWTSKNFGTFILC